jgi:hypothetical protein
VNHLAAKFQHDAAVVKRADAQVPGGRPPHR